MNDDGHYYYYYAAFNAPCVGHKADESQAIDKNALFVTSCFLRQGVMHGALEVDSML